jgi:hypothetical protein
MGPSILAAAFTTICSAVVMLFTVITFFQKFAIVLFFTILMATIGSFVVFITLADCLGPARPTYTVDLVIQKVSSCCCCCKGGNDSDVSDERKSKYAAGVEKTGLSSSDDSSTEKGMAPRPPFIDGRRTSLYADLAEL